MELAKNLLKKYGWKEGEGLGKNRDGISKPLKAHMKFDNSGLGTDAATEFNDHWWERCYNEASDNIKVSVESNGKVDVKVNDAENGVEITTKSYSTKKLKKAKKDSKDNKVDYGNFLYSSTMTNSGEILSNPEKISLDDIALRSVKILSDDELFKACGGLTAHKGARHGLKLSGKLKRLQEQEEELLAKINQGVNPFQNNPPKELSKKNKKTKTKTQEAENAADDAEPSSKNTDDVVESCKKTKKRKSETLVNEDDEEPCNEATIDAESKKKKKKKKSNDLQSPVFTAPETVTPIEVISNDDVQEVTKKKKSKKSRDKNK